jgi:hypothetical protein
VGGFDENTVTRRCVERGITDRKDKHRHATDGGCNAHSTTHERRHGQRRKRQEWNLRVMNREPGVNIEVQDSVRMRWNNATTANSSGAPTIKAISDHD